MKKIDWMKWLAKIGAVISTLIYLENIIYPNIKDHYLEFGITFNFFYLFLSIAIVNFLLYGWALIPLWYYGFRKKKKNH